MNNLPLTHQFFPSKTASKKLMIILHGRGDSSNGFTWLPSYLKMDDMNYLLLDAPYDYYGGRSWYDLPPNQLEGIEYSKKILTEILDQLFEERFEPTQTILFGFSQGSLLTFEFGARYQKSLAAYIGVSGYIYDAKKLLEEMNPEVKKAKWLCTHGTHDDILPYHISKSQVEVLQDGGFEIEFLTYDKDHTIIKEELDSMIGWILEVYRAN
jgi:phospholipase/carboxylesterase